MSRRLCGHLCGTLAVCERVAGTAVFSNSLWFRSKLAVRFDSFPLSTYSGDAISSPTASLTTRSSLASYLARSLGSSACHRPIGVSWNIRAWVMPSLSGKLANIRRSASAATRRSEQP